LIFWRCTIENTGIKILWENGLVLVINCSSWLLKAIDKVLNTGILYFDHIRCFWNNWLVLLLNETIELVFLCCEVKLRLLYSFIIHVYRLLRMRCGHMLNNFIRIRFKIGSVSIRLYSNLFWQQNANKLSQISLVDHSVAYINYIKNELLYIYALHLLFFRAFIAYSWKLLVI
jgi:hypothetical protein